MGRNLHGAERRKPVETRTRVSGEVKANFNEANQENAKNKTLKSNYKTKEKWNEITNHFRLTTHFFFIFTFKENMF